ncbi:MAG: 6-phosphogluconolactonase [Candidatus Levybacteria bacterium]|nr:6-phosphogluconolactonase [Candidatus Levybacteria bacterium]
MFDALHKILAEKNIRSHTNEGILVCNVDNTYSGLKLVEDILYTLVDKTTVLYLSGGRTPRDLYESFSTEMRLHPGGVGMVDERFGEKLHEKSNEKMLKDTGLLRYLDYNDIPFYPVLEFTNRHSGKRGTSASRISNDERSWTPARYAKQSVAGGSQNDREGAAQAYDEQLRTLLSVFQKHVAVLGIGLDGHTAGIAGNRPGFTNPLFEPSRKSLLVSEFDDPKGKFHERITMTFLGLSMMDILLVLVFGSDKQKALELMFSPRSEEEIPARFFKRPEIAAKTLFITDQNI